MGFGFGLSSPLTAGLRDLLLDSLLYSWPVLAHRTLNTVCSKPAPGYPHPPSNSLRGDRQGSHSKLATPKAPTPLRGGQHSVVALKGVHVGPSPGTPHPTASTSMCAPHFFTRLRVNRPSHSGQVTLSKASPEMAPDHLWSGGRVEDQRGQD